MRTTELRPTRVRPGVRTTLLASLASVVALAVPTHALAAPAVPGSGGTMRAVPTPTVEGPVPGTPVGAAPYDPTGAGYVEQEFFVSGTAKTYTTPSTTAPYKVRILVYRPTTAKAFNGTALAEWENVSGQAAGGHPMFAWLDRYALSNGYAFVQVEAQATPAPAGPVGQGQLGFQAMDPQRYASLKHPGDDYAFDIYSQAMRALTEHEGSDPMGGLTVSQIIATGNSQSGSKLHDYAEQVQREAGIADAMLIDAGGSKTYTKELAIPTIQLLSEDGLTPDQPNRTGNYRLWEVAGASHNDADFNRNLNAVNVPGSARRSWAEQLRLFADRSYGQEGPSEHATCTPGVGGNEYPRRFAVDAAISALRRWAGPEGVPAPTAPRVAYDTHGMPVRDAHHNVVGGLRLPPLDVPVATYIGSTCLLFGENLPLLPTTLSALYPTHQAYMDKMRRAVTSSTARGWLLPQDAAELLGVAQRSAIGS